MAAVQTPIVQVIGDLIRQNPGTISLGQGMVHYPEAALRAVNRLCRARGLYHISDEVYFRIAFGALQKETVSEGLGRLVRGLRAEIG